MFAAQRFEHTPISVRLEDVPRLTGIGRTKIYDFARTGDLPTFSVGRARLVKVSELAAFIDRQAASGASRDAA